jgi:hypothetical protein
MSTKKLINCSKLKDVATYLKKKDEASDNPYPQFNDSTASDLVKKKK